MGFLYWLSAPLFLVGKHLTAGAVNEYPAAVGLLEGGLQRLSVHVVREVTGCWDKRMTPVTNWMVKGILGNKGETEAPRDLDWLWARGWWGGWPIFGNSFTFRLRWCTLLFVLAFYNRKTGRVFRRKDYNPTPPPSFALSQLFPSFSSVLTSPKMMKVW